MKRTGRPPQMMGMAPYISAVSINSVRSFGGRYARLILHCTKYTDGVVIRVASGPTWKTAGEKT